MLNINMWGENPCEWTVLIQGPCVCKIKERCLEQTDGWMDGWMEKHITIIQFMLFGPLDSEQLEIP